MEELSLGPTINTAASEHHSFPLRTENPIYYNHERDGFGGEDIFVTTRGADGNWSELTNLGAQVMNQHDRCPAFSPNFETFFF